MKKKSKIKKIKDINGLETITKSLEEKTYPVNILKGKEKENILSSSYQKKRILFKKRKMPRKIQVKNICNLTEKEKEFFEGQRNQKICCKDCKSFEITSPYIPYESELDLVCLKNKQDFNDFQPDEPRECELFQQREFLQRYCPHCKKDVESYDYYLKCPECGHYLMDINKKQYNGMDPK